ncbi:MAG TPA: GTPase HflX, partial [Thermopetrobacter sp.]|nr:GTPase HflX [Thermopetrobacter sp.]
ALAGYTNAGKSTLFNALTEAGVMARDQLFATLDPTMRQLALPGGRKAILSDTVGFISDLPTQLVAAFRATLEEVVEADILLHVRDMSDEEEAAAQADDVARVLAEIGIDETRRGNMIEVWNKADLLDAAAERRLRALAARRDDVVIVSAVTGEGLDALRDMIARRLSADDVMRTLRLPPAAGADLAWCHRHAEVLRRHTDDDGAMTLTLRLSAADLARAERRFGDRLQPAAQGRLAAE